MPDASWMRRPHSELVHRLARQAVALSMLCGVGVALLHAEDARTIRLRSREGLVEQRATQLPWPAASPQRTRYTAPTYPAGLAAGVGVVTLQVTTAADGQVVEARAYEVTLRGPVEARADEAQPRSRQRRCPPRTAGPTNRHDTGP